VKIVVARYTSTTVFLSLLVSAQMGVFFSPSNVMEDVRQALADPNDAISLKYWTGICLLVSIFVNIAALIANFTAWQIFLVLSKENASILLRSSMGLYAAQLPSRLVMLSIYLLFISVSKSASIAYIGVSCAEIIFVSRDHATNTNISWPLPCHLPKSCSGGFFSPVQRRLR
jgi:hypothetical protein